MISLLLSIYVHFYKLREKLFGYDLQYGYFPTEILDIPFIVMMDFVWITRGLLGRNKYYVPKGNPQSKRFDPTSKYYQLWVGIYALRSLRRKSFLNDNEMVQYLSQAATSDQKSHLKLYGSKDIYARLLTRSLKPVKTKQLGRYKQIIFKSEIVTGLEGRRPHPDIVYRLGSLVAQKYSNRKVDSRIMLSKSSSVVENKRAHLFGYFAVTEISPTRFLMAYVCGTLENEELIDKELFRMIDSIKIVRT